MNYNAIKIIISENLVTFLYFPIWWYTKGLVLAFNRLISWIKNGARSIALQVWIVNWFKPMYSQYDWQGRIISIIMRTFMIIYRTFLLFSWVVFSVLVFILWIVFPVFVLYQIILQIAL